ncbi:MAG TPA: methionyl-tRNA formyltransferase [Gemmatimonadaceae bacterium]|nr:methionyl-tRNA formyltransferase [Gemmatimonadaceae bacterium]
MRVLFFGTPEFATPALRALLGEGHDVVGVVTQPDRPRKHGGRSRSVLDPSPVKEIAVEEGIPVLQPERARGPEFVAALRALVPEIAVVVAYGQILSEEVINVPPRGTLNIHASLLPEYRGAAPIQAAIRDGCTETGVSIMRVVPALDAGPVLLQLHTPIAPDETAGELQLRLAELGAAALIEALALVALGKAVEAPQNDALATFAPKIEREDARLPFDAPSDRVARLVRAYDPKPGAWTLLRGLEVRCFGARAVEERTGAIGEVLEAGEEGLLVACGEGAVRIAEVHPAGKKRLAAAQWVRGRGVKVGDQFG